MNPTTTIAKIKSSDPCKSGYKRLIKYIGKSYGEDTPITVRQLIDACGLEDAIWCFRTMPDKMQHWRLYIIRCAMHVTTDAKDRASLDAAERYVLGFIGYEDYHNAIPSTIGTLTAYAFASIGSIFPWDVMVYAAHVAAQDSASEYSVERSWQIYELLHMCEEE